MRDNLVRQAYFQRIIDGDTFVCLLDLTPMVSPQTMLKAHIRVEGWNAKELRESEGPLMRDQFEKLLKATNYISVKLSGMSFQRIVCPVYLDGVLFSGLLREQLSLVRHQLRGNNA